MRRKSEGRSGVSYIESFDTTGLAIKIAGEVKNFDVTPYLGEHKKNAKLMSRAVGFAVVLTTAAAFYPARRAAAASSGVQSLRLSLRFRSSIAAMSSSRWLGSA